MNDHIPPPEVLAETVVLARRFHAAARQLYERRQRDHGATDRPYEAAKADLKVRLDRSDHLALWGWPDPVGEALDRLRDTLDFYARPTLWCTRSEWRPDGTQRLRTVQCNGGFRSGEDPAEALAELERTIDGLALIVAVETEPNCKPKPSANGRLARDPSIEARDKFCYEQRCLGLPDGIILRGVISTPGWLRFKTTQGVRDAADRYAKRHGLKPPDPRKSSKHGDA